MLTDYIRAAMRHATYKILEDESFEGEIRGLDDVWSHAQTLEDCRDRLQGVLEEWIIEQLYFHHQIPPVIDGLSIDPARQDDLETQQELADIKEALQDIQQEGTVPLESLKAG